MLSRLRLPTRRAPDAVLSFNVRARIAEPARVQAEFEVLVRHLFDRMLNNEVFGEDAALRVTELAYAIALPGVLVALFLFPAYHGLPPHPVERSYWSQAADHLFYVTYAFVTLGTAMVFQWELLFPDLLDAQVLSSLPIGRVRLLTSRVTAVAIFAALVQIGTSGLGALFLPAVADLRCGFWRHLAAHAAAVTMAGVFASVLFLAMQGVVVCLLWRLAQGNGAAIVKAISVVVLLSMLFLFPLTAHFLPQILSSRVNAAHWFPPFWFLGVYESVLWGAAARPVFHELAQTGLIATAVLGGVGALLYPLAYAQRVRQLVEGSVAQRSHGRLGELAQRLLHGTILRTPHDRATFHFASQTLARLPRLQLYLSMYAGLGVALVISGLFVLQIDGSSVRTLISADGVRMGVPLAAFWTVAGLRTALSSPLGRQGSWMFRVVRGSPSMQEIRGATRLVALLAVLVTLCSVAMLYLAAPRGMHGPLVVAGQVVMGVGLCVVLTDLFFLRTRTVPFTAAKVKSTQELPWTLVRYFVLFPAFSLSVVQVEPWVEISGLHLVFAGLMFAMTHLMLRRLHAMFLRGDEPREEFLFVGLGLREQ